jgi:hypothetical protein
VLRIVLKSSKFIITETHTLQITNRKFVATTQTNVVYRFTSMCSATLSLKQNHSDTIGIAWCKNKTKSHHATERHRTNIILIPTGVFQRLLPFKGLTEFWVIQRLVPYTN